MRQVFAILVLRFHLTRRLFQMKGGALRALGSLIMGLGVLALSGGLALMGGAIAHVLLDSGSLEQLRPLLLSTFWVVVLSGLLLPLLLSGGVHGLDVAKFVSLPISRLRLFCVSLFSAFGSLEQLFCVPLLLVVFLTLFGSGGATLACALGFFFLVPLVVGVWAHALSMVLRGVTRSRRAREVLGITFLVGFVSLSLVPFLFQVRDTDNVDEFAEALRSGWTAASPLVSLLPPNLAADGVQQLITGDGEAALLHLLGLIPWLLLGLALGCFSFFKFVLAVHEGGTGARPASGEGRWQSLDVTTALPFMDVAVLAVASKELRYLLRSVMGRVNLILVPAVAAIAALVHQKLVSPSIFGMVSADVVLYGLAFYVAAFPLNSQVNAFAWEGPGFACYLISPIRARQVMKGKNLGLWCFAFFGQLLPFLLVWSLCFEFPSAVTMVTAILLLVFVVVVLTIIGNLLSVWFPVARDHSSMMNSPSQVGIVVGLVAYVLASLPVGASMAAASFLDSPWIGMWSLTGLVVVALLAWAYSLRLAGELMEERREELLEVQDAGPA